MHVYIISGKRVKMGISDIKILILGVRVKLFFFQGNTLTKRVLIISDVCRQ